MLERHPDATAYLALMFGHANVNSNLEALAVFLQQGCLVPRPPAGDHRSDQARRDDFSSLMVCLQQNNEYLALDRFLQYVFGLDDNLITNSLMEPRDGIDPVFLQEWYGGRENYMAGFLSRTLRASMIPEDVEGLVENEVVIVRHSAREGFRRLEAAFIAFNFYALAEVQQDEGITSGSSNDEDEINGELW
jgi:hypothetical protein